MSCPGFLLVAVLPLALVSADWVKFNVTLNNTEEKYILQSPNFPDSAPPNSYITWELSSPSNTKVALSCSSIKFRNGPPCIGDSLTIRNGITRKTLCEKVISFKRESYRNKMSVEFIKSTSSNGKFKCTASVKQIAAVEDTGIPDSSEHGQGVGDRNTSCPCGWTYKKKNDGGKKTLINMYVFTVGIKISGEKECVCEGSIATSKHIISSALCVNDIRTKDTQVVVGEHDCNSDSKTNVTQIISVSQIIQHEKFDDYKMINDIAILVLSEEIKFNNFVGPVCLPNEHYAIIGHFLKVLGRDRSNNEKSSNSSQNGYLKVIPLDECAVKYERVFNLENPSQICTFTNGMRLNKSDGGSPLIYHDSTLKRYVQIGIVSYSRKGAPAVNTDVFPYINWIKEVIKRSKTANEQVCVKT